MSDKYLIYYTHGYAKKYVELLKLSIESLRKYSNTDNIDILIMCDEQYVNTINDVENVIVLPMENSNSSHEASMHKLHIFEYENITKYKAVLFIDSDIIVHTNVMELLEKCLDKEKLYVSTEKTDLSCHGELYWSLQHYDNNDYNYFKENNIFIFNAGCFLFVPSKEMKTHFDNIITFIKNYTKPFFYEQSFMNVYFNKLNITNREVLTSENYILHPEPNMLYKNKIIHFCGTHQTIDHKLNLMKNYNKLVEIMCFDTRIHMIEHLVNKNGIYAEIGVFKGDFSKQLISLLNPQKLLLIDLFSGNQVSGDQNGNNVISANLEEEFNKLSLLKNPCIA